MERIPLPQPMSSMSRPGSMTRSRNSKHMRVVWWAPVPKAMPGSSFKTTRSVSGFSSQQGSTSSRSPIERGL